MYRKILIGGATIAVIAGAGGVAAAATTGSSSTPGAGSSSSSSSSSSHGKKHDGKKHHGKFRHLAHGSFVTGKHGKFVTHDIIRGTVSAVSPSSITVTAADKTSETFAVSKDTKIRHRTAGVKAKPSTSSISAVSKGDMAVVTGTGTSTRTAKHIVDVTKK